MDITLRMSDHALTARAAAAAGIVLLQNKNRTLPLLPQEDGAPLPVAVFGIKQLQTPAFDKTMTPCNRRPGRTCSKRDGQARRASGPQIPHMGGRTPGGQRNAADNARFWGPAP